MQSGIYDELSTPSIAQRKQIAARARKPKHRTKRRNEEESCLQLLAATCALQVILGRRYIIENQIYSDILSSDDSPPVALRAHGLKYHVAL